MCSHSMPSGLRFEPACNQNGKTGLFLACEKGHFDVVKLLADNGADPTLKTEVGRKGGEPTQDTD